MKCTACGGKGFIERHCGLIMFKCPVCDGEKEIPDNEGGLIDNPDNSGTGQPDKSNGSKVTRKHSKKRKSKASKRIRAGTA